MVAFILHCTFLLLVEVAPVTFVSQYIVDGMFHKYLDSMNLILKGCFVLNFYDFGKLKHIFLGYDRDCLFVNRYYIIIYIGKYQ